MDAHGTHIVQLYQDHEHLLTNNVSRYIADGLRRGDGVLVIGTARHNHAFLERIGIERIGIDCHENIRSGRLTFLDAGETLARLMVDGMPDWARFESTIRPAMWRVREAATNMELRAYGEMVGVLWESCQYSAAIQLEEYWNRLLRSSYFRLFCAYPIDVFSASFNSEAADALLRTHTHFVPTGTDGALEHAMNRAMDLVLGKRAAGLRALMKFHSSPSRAAIPRAESAILWLQSNLPRHAGEILDCARRDYHSTSAATDFAIHTTISG